MDAHNAKVVITGAGLVTPLGLSRESTWKAILAGECGLRELTAIEQPLPPNSTGGQAPDPTVPSAIPREVRYLREAIDEALDHAGVQPGRTYPSHRIGVMVGTTLHGMRAAGRFLRSGNHEFFADFLAGATIRSATEHLNITGFSATACSACSSSLGSIALAISMLRSGQLDVIIAGGYDTISEYVYGGFNSLRLVSPGPLRPFTRDRQGMKLAEGYGIVILERADNAERRRARPLATILGYGESADAHHLTQPHPQGEGAARAMNAALASAGVTPQDIDMIAAHATGTPDNDAGEFAALSRVWGDDLPRVPVVAFKSHLGHTLGGAGAVELILSGLSLRDQIVPACANVRQEDLEFPGLNVVTGSARPAIIRSTLNTSLGFGGANTCMVLGPASASGAEASSEDDLPSRRDVLLLRTIHPHTTREKEPVYITGVGVVLPGMVGNDAFAAMSVQAPRKLAADTGAIPETDLADLLNARRVRRMSDYVKLSLAAAMLACKDAAITDIPSFAALCPALLGSTHGASNFSEAYYTQIVREGIAGANPVLFAEGVPNAAAAHLSLMLGLKGACQTVIGTRTAGLDALHLAAARIASGEWDRAIVGAAEEYCPLVNAAYGHWGHYIGPAPTDVALAAGGFVVGAGAVTFVLESARSFEARGVRPRGRVLSSTGPVPMCNEALRHPGAISDVLRDVKHVVGSANGTWIDRLESLVLRRHQDIAVSSLYGPLAETFSVMPLAAIAMLLLTARAPAGAGHAHIDRLAVLATDYTRIMSAAAIQLESTR